MVYRELLAKCMTAIVDGGYTRQQVEAANLRNYAQTNMTALGITQDDVNRIGSEADAIKRDLLMEIDRRAQLVRLGVVMTRVAALAGITLTEAQQRRIALRIMDELGELTAMGVEEKP